MSLFYIINLIKIAFKNLISNLQILNKIQSFSYSVSILIINSTEYLSIF